MKKIKLAIIFDQELYSGGGYQQSLNAAIIATKLSKDLVEVIFYTNIKKNINSLNKFGIKVKFIKISFFSKIRILFYRKLRNGNFLKFLRLLERSNPREKLFLKDKIDLVYFLSPTSWARDLEKINYIFTVWDTCHRDDLEFPEVRWNKEFERREKNFTEILPKATAILVESGLTKINLRKRYGISNYRIHITPFKPAIEIVEKKNTSMNSIDIKKKYDLKIPYVFYPAQFWAHKNHIYILEGLRNLRNEYNIEVGAIFSGRDRGNLDYIKKSIENLKLTETIKFAGFVSNHEMIDLYKQSLALVMPTYFGPTNLPPLEAFEIGTPVLYPDIQGLRDQVGDAALLMDLKDSMSMALQLKKLYFDKDLRNLIINNGKKRLEFFNSIDHVSIINAIIKNFAIKRKCWE